MATSKSSSTKKSTNSSKSSSSKKKTTTQSVSNKIEKQIKKDIKKTAKKHPVAVIVIILVIFIILGGGVLVAYKMGLIGPKKETYFKLNGRENTSVPIDGTYEEKGAILMYEGIDKSSEITVKYYHEITIDEEKQKEPVTTITTSVDGDTFYAIYSINADEYPKIEQVEITRTINIGVDEISINFLELGNIYTGDSTYIKAGDVDILIDAGSRKDSATAIKNYITAPGRCEDGKLDFVIATHAHQDHIAGFVGSKANPGILDSFEIGTLIKYAQIHEASQLSKDFDAKIEERKAASKIDNVITAYDCVNEQNGGKQVYDLAIGITMTILNQKYYAEESSDENNHSVCTLFTQGNKNYLLTGDLEKEGEESLVAMNPDLPKVQLFKGGHHGSYTASNEVLLDKIQPETVCICCCAGTTEYTQNSDNTFPAQAAINRMAKWTEKIYVTSLAVLEYNSEKAKWDLVGVKSLNGNIDVRSKNGKDYTVTGSNNNTILKDTEWFKANRTWPTV